MRSLRFLFLFCLLLSGSVVLAQLPAQPTEENHPGSGVYKYALQRETFQINGRKVDVFLPKSAGPVPVIVFGHGQAIGVEGYEKTFEHLAKKGIAVIHPMFDTGFFDQDWRRMAADFNSLSLAVLEKFKMSLDASRVIFSGHSKGGYIALMAAGAPGRKPQVGSLVLFAPAGYDPEYLQALNPNVPMTLIWSEADTIIKRSLIEEIYERAPVQHKQWILAKSYESLKADHFFLLNKSYFFGGRNGVSAFHFFSVWKWLLGAGQDLLNDNGSLQNSFLYGEEALQTGVRDLLHDRTRNW